MEDNNPVILVYRRDHKGDPDERGIFGIDDCMGRVRNWEYKAVIGIGGSKPSCKELTYKINWIGFGPDKVKIVPMAEDRARMKMADSDFKDFRAPFVTFDRFLLLNESGPLVKDKAPNLHKYMFEEGRIPHQAKNFEKLPEIYAELKEILKLADDALPSRARDFSIKSKPVNSKCSSSNGTNKSRGCV